MTDVELVLVHSPLMGSATWGRVANSLVERGARAVKPSLRGVEAASPPYWSSCVDRVVDAVEPGSRSVVLVGHSGSGPLLPVIGERLPQDVRAYLFVDATIPARSDRTPIVPPQFLDGARAEDGWVPRWSEWWGEDTMRAPVPDDTLRAQIEDEMRSLPLAYFEEAVPVPRNWLAARCGYLRLSELYEPVAADAESRGWPVVRVEGGHLHMLVDPGVVTAGLMELAGSVS